MFPNLGWGEIIVLAIVGLLIFGPDRLPKAAADAARVLRQVRTMARGAAADLRAELGTDVTDLASLHPRRLVASVFDDVDEPADSIAVPETIPARPVLAAGETPPYDEDAT